jgi:hypothetical protein
VPVGGLMVAVAAAVVIGGARAMLGLADSLINHGQQLTGQGVQVDLVSERALKASTVWAAP